MTIAEAMRRSTERLSQSGIADAVKDAGLLLSFAMGRDRTFIIAHPETELSTSEVELLAQYITRRAAREPLQYITRRQGFYGLEFEVTQDVLIPRPETELLVEKAIEVLTPRPSPRFCEIGVGSGCISVSLLHELPNASAVAGDISQAALAVAHSNAVKHNVEERLQIVVSDIFSQLPNERFDAVLSNPPYVPAADVESLQAEVRDHEPATALFGGDDGLAIIEKIVREAPEHLVGGGTLIMEIGFNQMARVEPLFGDGDWKNVDFLPDLQGIPRIVVARI